MTTHYGNICERCGCLLANWRADLEIAKLRAVVAAADRFILLRKTSHDGDEIHAALEDFYAVRAKLESEK